jgi:hypothetical protein
MGMGMMIGQRSTFGRLDTLDPNLRSAAEMPGMATRYAGIPVGMPAAGMQHQRQHQHQHQHQHQQPSGLPPEYTSNHNLAAYGGDGIMAGAAMVNSYSSYPSIRPSPPSSNSPPLPQSVPRERPNHYEHVPMGAYADTKAAKQPLRSHADPHASMHLNRGQPSSQKIGSLGQEWLDGDAFLDACICTTSCSCRKSHRVLYRARKDDHKAGSDSDGEHHEYTSGEIRYVLKDDLGRDCGDHTECRENKIDSDKEDKSSKNKDRKEGKKLQRQFRGFKDELLEALDERLDDMRKERRQRSEAQGPAWPSLGASGLGQSLNMVNNSPGLDARMAEEMGIRNYDPYGVTVSRIDPLPHGFSGLAAPGMRGHGNDVSDMNDMGLHTDIKGNADMSPDMTMGKRNAMRPNLTSHHGAKAQNPGGRGGVVERHSSSGSSTSSARRGWAHRDYESDEFDVGVGRDGSRMRSTTRQRGRFERTGKSRYHDKSQSLLTVCTGRGNNRLGSRNQDMPSRDNVGSSPHERTDHSRSRARRARADTDDDDAY